MQVALEPHSHRMTQHTQPSRHSTNAIRLGHVLDISDKGSEGGWSQQAAMRKISAIHGVCCSKSASRDSKDLSA
eukprot:907089-Amphidinium_carterae.1